MQEQAEKSAGQAKSVFAVQVTAMRLESQDVLSIELRHTEDRGLPPASPGSHVDIHLADGVTRPYSVVSGEEGIYLLAVKREAGSRGGSAFVHDRLRVGDVIQVSAPRNQFALADHDGPSMLVAGGIGITPLLPMARALEREGRPWCLHYSAGNAAAAAFARELRQMGERVHLHSSASTGRIDLGTLVADAPPGTHFYCCGPEGMLDAFAEATRDIDPARVHVERFGAAAPPQDAGSFELRLARSGRSVMVGPEVTTLDALLQAGVDVDYSCRQGICGSCEVRVLEGIPEHHDEILTAAERASNRTMMVCCSRACSRALVLDL
ncbi:vanillate O-demethylase ferredoxin subunit [Variovorax boronicumulans]|uniref:PDR/VanB family oxidoreductase n=1 Tax=Variovorax TaxID=34072 RepID=UPI00278A55DA|nr:MULTISPECIES: PDR/VanB family oxidoreductase [Variovorax]MDQ0074452.1 vanillate O-demethylase ferredoxin subunit [Variovorax boronicumulans]MDQ0608144.1 ferredoxin-NADP reductase [Variovorax sp. W1I1]